MEVEQASAEWRPPGTAGRLAQPCAAPISSRAPAPCTYLPVCTLSPPLALRSFRRACCFAQSRCRLRKRQQDSLLRCGIGSRNTQAGTMRLYASELIERQRCGCCRSEGCGNGFPRSGSRVILYVNVSLLGVMHRRGFGAALGSADRILRVRRAHLPGPAGGVATDRACVPGRSGSSAIAWLRHAPDRRGRRFP